MTSPSPGASGRAGRRRGRPPLGGVVVHEVRVEDLIRRREVVLVLGPASVETGAADASPAGLEALRRLVEAGAHPRKAAGVVAELTGGSANALYRALTAKG